MGDLSKLTMEDLCKLKSEFDTQVKEATKHAADMEAEISVRKDRAALDRFTGFAKVLIQNPGLVDALAPKHDRTNCSDANPQNGFGSGDRDLPRCRRCALLHLRKEEWLSLPLVPTIEFRQP